MHEIKALTGLRGYAAIWVCLLHYTWGIKDEGFFADMVRHGSGGLVAFFVLSGFILSYVYAAQLKNGVNADQYKAFLWARIARVYPLHLLTLIAWLGLISIGLIDPWKGDTAYTFALNAFLLHAWGFTDLISWNQPSWSISAELFAYLLFPVVIGPIYRSKTWVVVAVVAALYLCMQYAPHVYLIYFLAGYGVLTPGAQFANGASLIQFFTLFVFGVAIFSLADRLMRWTSTPAFYDGMTVLGLAVFAYATTVPFSDPLMASATAALIIGLYRDAGLGRAIFGSRPSKFLGDISYALYLSHIMVGIVVIHFAGRVPHWGWRLAAAIAVSTILHYAFERPARSLLRRLNPFPDSGQRTVPEALRPAE